jgi:hypothetical protein
MSEDNEEIRKRLERVRASGAVVTALGAIAQALGDDGPTVKAIQGLRPAGQGLEGALAEVADEYASLRESTRGPVDGYDVTPSTAARPSVQLSLVVGGRVQADFVGCSADLLSNAVYFDGHTFYRVLLQRGDVTGALRRCLIDVQDGDPEGNPVHFLDLVPDSGLAARLDLISSTPWPVNPSVYTA